MGNLALLLQLVRMLGPKVMQAWPLILQLIDLLSTQPRTFAADSAPRAAATKEDFIAACTSVGVSAADAKAAADKLE